MLKTRVKLVEADRDEYPRCPHCKKTLDEIKVKSTKEGLLKDDRVDQQVLFCPQCKALLGFAAWDR